MITLCGFCEQPTHDLHSCIEEEYFTSDLESLRVVPNGMSYSPTSIAMAELFLKEHPEFNDQPNAVGAYFKVGVGLTREQEDWITPVDYEEVTGLPVLPNFTEELTRDEEWQGIFDNREVQPNLSNWRDVEPKRCTTSFHWWKGTYQLDSHTGDVFNAVRSNPQIYMEAPNRVPEGFNTEESYVQEYEALDFDNSRLMRLEFHELQAFASELLIDADITERFQYKVFNAYVGRDEKFHIGLLTFDRIGDDVVRVVCKRGGCKLDVMTHLSVSRAEMEDFVLNCIRHGNNHGPDWLIQRADFTKIHANNCDVNHSDREVCNANSPRYFVNELNAEDFDAVFNFLIQHRKFCSSKNCRCTHYYHLLNERFHHAVPSYAA